MRSGDGKISSCATSGCGWRCCQFQQGNFIALYPGEIEQAEAAGQPTAHLKIIDKDYHGGKKAVCTARDTATCDGGFKPLDCASYPFFPAQPKAGVVGDLLIKGKKCPLQTEHLAAQAAMVRTAWGEKASEVWQERVRRETPLRRWGTPQDVAAAARWLASPAAAFVTGQVVRVNGGAVR